LTQIATVIIKVDLHCCSNSKKIKKALCELQNWFNIESIVYDEKKNTVTVSGHFNPECFIRKLRCLACKVIEDVQIKPRKPPPSPPPEDGKPTPDKPQPPPEVVVKLHVCVFPPSAWPVGCCQPYPCYEPRRGCRRCCSCGLLSDGRHCYEGDGYKIVLE
ncbi:unnamed protein product, partial [Musa acuminata var. zebrina]